MKPKSTLRHFLCIASSAVLTISYAHAASLYWDGTNASWNANTNWSTASGADTPDPVAVPGALDDTIFNITTVNSVQSITLDANQAAKSLTFNNTGTSTLLGGGTARTLTSGTGGITTDAAAGAVILGDGTAANDVLISLTNGTRTWTNNSAANLTINNSAASFTRVAGATLGFNKLGAGDFSMSTTVLPNTNDIVGPWAFFGTGGTQRYAFNNAGTIADYTAGTAAADANAFASATANYDLTSAAITLTGNRTANTFRSAGAGGIIDLGASGTNTLTANGILAVGSGTLSINRTGGTGTVVIGASNELVIAGSQAVSIGAPISGTAKSLTYSGTSSLTLSAATFTGALNINSGTLNASFAPTYTSANLAAGATWNYLNAFGNNPSFTNPFTINGSFIKTGNGSMTFGSAATISGSGSLSFSGQVTLFINSDNPNFTGTITEISQGGNGFNIGHNGALGAGLLVFGANNNDIRSTVGGPGYVAAYASTYRFDASRTFGGNFVNLDFGAGAVTLNSNPTITVSNTTTFGGAIGQTGGTRTLTKAGAGTLILGGSAANTYGGLTSVTAGTLSLGKSSTANAIGAGGLSVGTGATAIYSGASTDMIANAAPVTVTGTGLLNLNGVSDTIGTLGLTAVAANNARVTTGAGTLTLGGNVTFTAATTGTAQITGNLDLGAATRTFTVGAGTGAGQDLLINAAISGTGAGLTKTGTGRLTLSGTNTYDGLTTVSDGRLTITNGAALSGGGGLTVAANKSFVYAPAAAGALTLGSGVLTLGSGTTTSIGTALGGTLSQSAITSSSAASLAGTGVVNIYAISGVAPALGTHNLITAASGLSAGTYTLGTIYNNTDFTVSNFTRATDTAISVDVTTASALSGNVLWKGGLAGNTGVWSASNGSTQSNWQVTDTVNQPLAPGSTTDLVFSATTSPGTMAGMTLGANVTIRSLTINNTATAFGLGGSDGTLTIGTGGITIGAGVQASSISVPIILGAAQTWTNNSVNALTVSGVVDNAGNLLTVDGTGTIAFNGNYTGSGGITKNGTGRFNFPNSALSYTGPTTINGGVLFAGDNHSYLSNGNLTLNGGVLEHRWTTSITRSLGTGAGQLQIIGGASGFSENGSTAGLTLTLYNNAATEVVWGAANEAGNINSTGYFNPSTLLLNTATSQGTASVTLQNKLDLNATTRTISVAKGTTGAASATLSGVIRTSTGTAGLTKTGDGTLLLSAANTFNGTTTISDGILSLTNAAALQNSALDTTNSVAGGASVGLRTNQTTLTLGGLIGNKDFDDTAGSVFTTTTGGYSAVTALTLNPATGQSHSYSGAIGNGAATTSLTKSGAGTQTLTGTSSYTGTTTVSVGKLFVNGDQTSATGAVSVSANATLGGTGTLGGNTTIAATGKLEFNLSTAAGSHDKLELAATKTLTFTGASTLTITSSGGASTGLYTLATAPGGITGVAPATVNLPLLWTADPPAIVGNDLVINITSTGGGGPGPLDHFAISAIGSPQTVGTPITGITLTAQDASNATVTSFTGTVTFGGTGGFTGTSASFVAGVLNSVSVTPTVAGSNLTFTVDDGASHTGTATITTIQTQYAFWSGGLGFDVDTNGDGVKNGLAFLLGASGPNAAVTLPTVTQSGGNLVLSNFSSRNLASRGTATLSVQHSSDLGIGDPWTTVLVPEATAAEVSGVSYNITPGSPLNTVNTATISVSQSAAGKLFGRLKATE